MTNNTPVSLRRFVITGPECSGKTSLANALAKILNAPYIAEIAREYLTEHPLPYSLSDVLHMSKLQLHAIETGAVSAEGIQVCDTGMLVYKIWLEDKFSYIDEYTEQAFKQLPVSCYLLCCPDIRYEADPLREDPGRRKILFKRYEDVLNDQKMLYKIIKGDLKTRIKTSLEIIRPFLV